MPAPSADGCWIIARLDRQAAFRRLPEVVGALQSNAAAGPGLGGEELVLKTARGFHPPIGGGTAKKWLSEFCSASKGRGTADWY